MALLTPIVGERHDILIVGEVSLVTVRCLYGQQCLYLAQVLNKRNLTVRELVAKSNERNQFGWTGMIIRMIFYNDRYFNVILHGAFD